MAVLGIANAGPDPLTDGIRTAIAESAIDLGFQTRDVCEPDQENGTDILLIVGYPRAYARFLEATPRSHRIAWFGEPLPPTVTGGQRRFSRSSGPVMAGSAVIRRFLGPITRRPLPGPLRGRREGAVISYERAANLADARWCSRLVDEVVVTSRDRAQVLVASGIEAREVPFGYHPAQAGSLAPTDGVDRDIAVATLASGIGAHHLRRGRLFESIRPALESLGRVVTLEGVWGPERDAVLRRTRILLDIHRIPGNFTGLRFLTAFAAGAVLVTEPFDDAYPFVSGHDHIEAPFGRIVDEVAALLDDEPARRMMASTAQDRLRDELSMSASLERVLGAA